MSNMKKIKEIDEVEWNKEDSGLILPKTNDLITRIDTKKSFIEPNEKINPIRTKVKWGTDNLTLILLIPSLLGAIWQILSLAKMICQSVKWQMYVRFLLVCLYTLTLSGQLQK